MKSRSIFCCLVFCFIPLSMLADDSDDESKFIQTVKSLGGEIEREGSDPEKPITGLFFDGSKKNKAAFNLTEISKIRPGRADRHHELNDDSLKELLEAPELSHLSTIDIFFCPHFTDRGMLQLAQIDTLKRLNLGECHAITDDGLKAFEGNETLSFLALQNCKKVTDEGIKSIGQMKGLKFLLFRGNKQITETGLAELKSLQHLTNLDLQRVPVTAAGLKEISQIPNVRTLYLSSKELKDADLLEFENMKRLGLLELIGCDRITNSGVKELQQSRPRLLIVRRGLGAEVLSR